VKIAIASDWFAPRLGGIESQLLQLAERLGSRAHDVDVLTSTPGANDGNAFHVRSLNVMTLPKLQLAISPALVNVLHRELQRGYDVVHAHVSVVSPVGYAAAAVARSLGLPTVLTFHSILRNKTYLLRAVNAVADVAKSAAVWSGVSDLVVHQVRHSLGEADVVALPNGIDLGFWRATRSPSGTRPSEGTTLVSTMRLHRKKRPLQLVRAFALAATRLSAPARLLIVGDGPERAVLQREIRELGLVEGRARVELLGWLDAHRLRAVYTDADGFVLPSTRESFGIAALEARAAGLPVIAMETSGSGEFLDHETNALICRDDAELMRAMVRFMSDAQLRRELAHGLTHLERYDWSAVLAQHEAAYVRAMRRAAVAAGAVVASA
jgi:glycosyltransferase involved in cell wall biosynthesis